MPAYCEKHGKLHDWKSGECEYCACEEAMQRMQPIVEAIERAGKQLGESVKKFLDAYAKMKEAFDRLGIEIKEEGDETGEEEAKNGMVVARFPAVNN